MTINPNPRTVYHDLATLSVRDLLALILKEREAAEGVALAFNSLRDLVEASPEELQSVEGIGVKKALHLVAIGELARRYASMPPECRPGVSCPSDVARLLGSEMRHLNQEVFKCVLLNTKNEIIQIVNVSVGTLNASLVHPREVFRAAIKRSCAAVILSHNHPSGNPTPSSEDLALTRRLCEAGRVLGIEVLDHVIIGDERFHSFKEHGQL